MNSRIERIVLVFLILSSVGCGQHRTARNHNDNSEEYNGEPLYYRHTDTTDNAWNNTTEFFHYWKKMRPDDYLFGPFPADSVSSWKSLCKELNDEDRDGFGFIPANYANMNQHVTIYDLIAVWRERGYNKKYDDFTLWRIEQFRCDTLKPVSVYEKFDLLRSTINSICDFEPFAKFEYDNMSCLGLELQEFYDRMLLRESMSLADPPLSEALLQEDTAWKSYHSALDSTYHKLFEDPNHLNGSAWGQSLLGALQDDALIREHSLADLCFSSVEQFKPETHSPVSDTRVIQEYWRFMNSFEENEYHYPIKVRKKALEIEMAEWQKWMKSRVAVSDLLKGREKELYDNSTNNARRMKYIMLKNRYEGYGVTSDDVMELLIPYSVLDDELSSTSSFDEKWKNNYGFSL